MSVENPASDNDCDAGKVNGNKSEHVNGIHNGYSSSEKHKSSHKSSSKDKHRDKDRDHKSSSKHSSSSSRDKEKDKHSSSRSHSSSHKSSSKDKDRDKDHKDRSDKDKDRSDKDKDKDRDKHRSDKDKHRDKDKERSDKDKHRSSDGDKKSSSSKDKEHKSKDRDKDRDKDRHRSDKDKHRSDKDRHSSSKDKHSSSRHKEKSSSEKHEKIKLEPDHDSSAVKQEPMEVEEPKIEREVKKVEKIKNEFDDDGYLGVNTTASLCDFSVPQFKEDPLSELPPDDDSASEGEGAEEDVPLSKRVAHVPKKRAASESEEDTPLLQRKKIKKKVKKDVFDEDDDDEEEAPKKKKKLKPEKTKSNRSIKSEPAEGPSPTKRKKKGEEEEQEVWKWWEESKKDDGTKWTFLEHKGPLFAPPYEPLPQNVKFRYDGKVMRLSQDAEEVAGFYARMLDHDYTTKSVFNNNFFTDWKKVMTHDEAKTIKDLSKCDFKEMQQYFLSVSEKNKNRSKEEKAALKAKNEEIQKEYGFCTIDGHKEKIGNFRIEPPGLFRGRGEHPKMGMLKKRVVPEDVLINCSKDSKVPKAPAGHKWREVRHDNSVTWLASWTENVQGQAKYVMLNPSSKLKGEKDWQKYETARKLHKCIDKIRDTYRADWKAKEMRIRQRAVALYFIDRLALRAGNEKDDDQADTVGCCSLRVEHIELHKEKDGKEYVVVFDFLGKDSIRYYNEVPVEKRVFKNLEHFMENKKDSDDLFDRLTTQTLNEHLKELMPGLTAKVFRTYNASITLQRQLDELTDPDASLPEKILAYNRANRAVAILCNHQRAVPKGHSKSMEALKDKIQAKRDQIDEAESDLHDAMKAAKRGSVKEKLNADKKKKALERLKEQLKKLEVQELDRDENKTIALGTSKLNYLDPRISVSWCKKHGVPIEKIYNKTQRDKFRWAIDMAGPDYVF
nr:DNA topoisomerase I, mitochondrial isoform X2 [Maniola hyperantus]